MCMFIWEGEVHFSQFYASVGPDLYKHPPVRRAVVLTLTITLTIAITLIIFVLQEYNSCCIVVQ